MWLNSVYGPHVPVYTPNNIWACLFHWSESLFIFSTTFHKSQTLPAYNIYEKSDSGRQGSDRSGCLW